jgi:hypothetical protein
MFPLLVITLKLREKLQLHIEEINSLQVMDQMVFLLFKTQTHSFLEAKLVTKIEAENWNRSSFL